MPCCHATEVLRACLYLVGLGSIVYPCVRGHQRGPQGSLLSEVTIQVNETELRCPATVEEKASRNLLCAVQVIWTVLVESIPTVGKNTQQVRAAIQKQVKAYEKLLNAFCGSARVEASLIVHVQVCC